MTTRNTANRLLLTAHFSAHFSLTTVTWQEGDKEAQHQESRLGVERKVKLFSFSGSILPELYSPLDWSSRACLLLHWPVPFCSIRRSYILKPLVLK